MFKAGRTITGMCLMLAFLCALTASSARAGTYEVAVCHDPGTGWTAPTDAITYPTSGDYLDAGVYEGCGTSGYVYATLDGGAPHGPDDVAAWEFQAPADTTIESAELWRADNAEWGYADRWPLTQYETISSSGAIDGIDACSQAWGCAALGTGPSTELDPANELTLAGLTDVTAIEGTAICAGGLTCTPGSGAFCPELNGDFCIASNHLYAMVLQLGDDTAPTAGDVSGTLVTNSVLSGEVGVSFDATDTGSGLYSTSLAIDGATVATTAINSNGGHCVPLDDPGGSVAAAVRLERSLRARRQWLARLRHQQAARRQPQRDRHGERRGGQQRDGLDRLDRHRQRADRRPPRGLRRCGSGPDADRRHRELGSGADRLHLSMGALHGARGRIAWRSQARPRRPTR